MFSVVARNQDTGMFGVLDTSDFVVEFYEFADLKGFVQQGIQINGIQYNGGNKVWDVVLQKGAIPSILATKIKDVAFSEGGEDEYPQYVKELTSYFLNMQRLGENLLKLGKKLKHEDIRSLLV